MKRWPLFFFTFGVCLVLHGTSSPARSYDLGNKVRINGFLSQGYIKSQDNNFFGESKDGSFQLNEFGLTLNGEITDNLRVGLQLLSRDLGAEGNNKINIDWGMADYRWRDWLGVRIGKVKLPIGLYNQGRDSDFLRPMVFLPQSIYDENKRSLVVAATGANIYGNLSVGQGGDLEYQAYYGEVDFPEDSGQAQGMRALGAKQASRMGKSIAAFEASNRYVYGGSLIYSPPVEGLRLGISYFNGKSKFDFKLLGSDGSIQRAKATGNNRDFIVYSVEYARERWTLALEYMESTANRVVFERDIPGGRSQGGYAQICYRVIDPVAVYALYDLFYANKKDRDGSKLVARGEPDYLGWRKDLGMGLRWDVSDNWVLKAEWHKVDGASLQLPIFNPEGVKRDWHYYVLKASYNF
ncbi:MAG: hypothetical protein RBR43_06870 [Desulfuromonadaceae bacterium]|nr:hypothetical protein [Desulfuromonas sp.]MDY0185582.1 hypothetical protein [Desulfuromonadaceae bacterium]